MAARVWLNYIDGRRVAAQAGATMDVRNPASPSELVGIAQQSDADDVAAAVAAAQRAKVLWKRMPAPARGEYLYRAAAALEGRLEAVAETMTREMGKTLPESLGETARGVAILKYYAGEGMREVGDVIPSADGSGFMYSTREPLGVVGLITPWNFPVAIPLWKAAPALVYGNAVVLKPSELAPITAALIAECFHEAGLPDGVFNLVTGGGSELGQAVASHPAMDAISFTGSERVGRLVGRTAFDRGAKYQLEMGGKNPVIVASDADLELAVEGTISGAFRSTGQKCTATSRAFVHCSVYETFRDRLVERTRALAVGNGLEPGVWMGPCASGAHLETALRYIGIGAEEGARLLTGGKRPPGLPEGYYIEPAVFDNVAPGMRIAREEIFGPVVALIAFDTLEEALRMANDTRYGLSASLYTRNIADAMTFVRDMDAGLVRVNAETAGVELQAPFGGVKMSGSHSREQGRAATEFYTSLKTVFVKP